MGNKKIVLVNGNGFDLDLGLKTAYKDFWNTDYCPKDFPAPIIKHLNQALPSDKEWVKWYDLENALLEYALLEDKADVLSENELKYIKSNSDYQLHNKLNFLGCDETFLSIAEKGYITISESIPRSVSVPYREELLESSNWRDRRALALIKEGLINYLSIAIKEGACTHTIAFAVLFALRCANESGSDIKIHSFNYTPLPSPYNQSLQEYTYHVHGRCIDRTIVIGTRDFEKPQKQQEYLQKSFDSNHNPSRIVEDLHNGDEIIIFGHSLGVNDDPYFNEFFENQSQGLSRPKTVFIFTKDQDSEIEIKRSLQRLTGNKLMSFRSKNDVKIIKTDDIYNNPNNLLEFMQFHVSDQINIQPTIAELHKAEIVTNS